MPAGVIVPTSEFGNLPLFTPPSISDGVQLRKEHVGQATSNTTAVTLNALTGVISTQAADAAAGVSASFTLNDSKIQADSIIQVAIIDYAGAYTTNGLPIVAVDNIAAGSCDIVVSNAHSSAALSGVLKISFVVM